MDSKFDLKFLIDYSDLIDYIDYSVKFSMYLYYFRFTSRYQ